MTALKNIVSDSLLQLFLVLFFFSSVSFEERGIVYKLRRYRGRVKRLWKHHLLVEIIQLKKIYIYSDSGFTNSLIFVWITYARVLIFWVFSWLVEANFEGDFLRNAKSLRKETFMLQIGLSWLHCSRLLKIWLKFFFDEVLLFFWWLLDIIFSIDFLRCTVLQVSFIQRFFIFTCKIALSWSGEQWLAHFTSAKEFCRSFGKQCCCRKV